MCQPTRCRTCSKTTWSGCGSHVDQVMSGVAKKNRCACPRDANGRSPKPQRASKDGKSMLQRLLGR